MTTQAIAVQFHSQTLTAAMIGDIPYVAMKPICENIGLQWEGQLKRIKRHPVLNRTMSMMDIVAEDGKLRSMVMLPLKMLNGWLFGVDTNRVKPETKAHLIEYQEECFDVLSTYFVPKEYGLKQLPEPKTKKALPGGLTLEMQDEIKALIKERVEALPKDKWRSASMQLWGSIKKKFSLAKEQSYKDLSPEHYASCLSMLARLELKGDLLLHVTPLELAALVDERVKAIEGELLEKETSPFMNDNAYRREAQKAFNDHFDSCHADMKQAGVTPPAWPVIDDKIIDGLAASMLWRTRWVMSFDNDQRMQLREMSNNDCIVDPRNPGQIESFINHLDLNMLHHVTDAIFARMIRQQDMAKKTNGTGKSQS